MNLSIVIISKNSSAHIAGTLASVQGLGGEVIVYDSGSTDKTINIAKSFGAKVVNGIWEGYGRNRYKASMIAKYDWILMIDSDEVIDTDLKNAIKQIDLNKEHLVYNMRYRNFFGSKEIKFGEWGNDSHIRMANRKKVQLEQEIVHEKLFLQPGLHIITLDGYIKHYTVKNCEEYAQKSMEYAWLSAEKYKKQGRGATVIKVYLSPLFAFVQNYFLKMGFRDGREGFICACMTAWYTFMKYTRLNEMIKAEKLEEIEQSKLTVSKILRMRSSFTS